MYMNMQPYEKTEQFCKYGHFDIDKKAGYTLTEGNKLISSWYYVYQNRKILLYVDQNGPVKIQYQPPSGILVTKRELGETESKWLVWVSSSDINGGVPVSNFNSPKLRYDLESPKFTVNWTPAVATYKAEYDNVDIITEIFVPADKATVCMKTTIVNKIDKVMELSVTPAIFPYINIPQMVAWDLPEWYLGSQVYCTGKTMTVSGMMKDPGMDATKERSVTVNFDYDEEGEFELSMSQFAGAGNFFSPDAIKKGMPFTYKMPQAQENPSFGSYQAVYAARYRCVLPVGGKKTYTQVLTVQDERFYSAEENLYEQNYFDEKQYAAHIADTEKFYDTLFGKRMVHTQNPLYNNFINYFTPLQMYWVCSLDRGWPSSMRGVRDASQDFVGMLPLDTEWTRELIISLFEHQSMDGWMPRQISTISREAPHDMRYFSDGGAFLIELVHEYLTYTRDASILEEKVWWLDSDEKDTVLEHLLKCVGFYLDEENIGEHGLCKVWYGDWWDVMDKIGMEGRGETVTVTAQMILNLKYLVEMFGWLYSINKVDDSYLELAKNYLEAREKFLKAMREHAYNKLGFFNGYFNDNGKWLLSDKDPDGEERMYLVSNSWAVISGAADSEMKKSVLREAESRCFGRMGYNTHSKAYMTCVDKAGRVGNGNSREVGPYNHAQSFFVRACCAAGDPEKAYKATRYILPIEEKYAPVDMTYAPPYAIANSYSNSDTNLHRVELQFLSGTVSYVLRNVYSYFLGITYGYEGLTLKPCIPAAFGDCIAEFTYLGNKFTVNYKKTEKSQKTVIYNGKLWNTEIDIDSGKMTAYFADTDMAENNVIEFEY